MLKPGLSLAAASIESEPNPTETGFPLSDYTPYGYLDNPFHCWNLHRSGILRSSPGIGYGYYYPAGPGGYFDFAKNGIYEVQLRLGFLIKGRVLLTPQDFRPGQLTSPYHSKNLHSFAFTQEGTTVESTFLQASENAIAARIAMHGSRSESVHLIAVLDCKLGGAAWWGRDGLVGSYDPAADSVWIRSFAAGKVFVVAGDLASQWHFVGPDEVDLRSWFVSPSNSEKGLSYHPSPLRAALLFNLETANGAKTEHTLVLARAENAELAQSEVRQTLTQTRQQWAAKYAEDAKFWKSAPRLEGDWPTHWKHGWVYDLETLRMMVRRPVGIYKHPWDAMQIQAPRTVLAESSIDMWALSYADAAAAKEVVYGMFANAPSDGVPCSREDGEMNMVAADGAECGTSISWCYPFFCAHSIWARTADKQWLAKLYPLLVRFFRWTLKNRTDAEGFVIGKCSWETGMDASKRFLIQQPTGGELIEFLRIVELQAATSHAAGVLQEFAEALGDANSQADWEASKEVYAAKTQVLWKEDWFYDFDTRNRSLVTSVDRDLGQVAPAFCDITSEEQKQKMLPTLHKFFTDSLAGHLSKPGGEDWQDGLHWSSLVLPYVESLWSVGELGLASQVIQTIVERVYLTTDRRTLTNPSAKTKQTATVPTLGWPGVSCEVWGGQGAYGGEGYGWGAVLPAHIIRSLVGFRDPRRGDELPLAPNLPTSFMVPGKTYRVLNLQHRGALLELAFHVLDPQRVRVEGKWSGSLRTTTIRDERGASVELQQAGSAWQFEGENHHQYVVCIVGVSQG